MPTLARFEVVDRETGVGEQMWPGSVFAAAGSVAAAIRDSVTSRPLRSSTTVAMPMPSDGGSERVMK